MRETDQALLRRYSESADQRAFEEIVKLHGGMVMGIAVRKVGQRELAEEICQNVFTILARKAESVLGSARNATVAGWLHRTTVLEASNFVRSDQRRRQRLLEYQDALPQPHSWDAGAVLKEQIDDAIQHLEEPHRRLVIMRFIEGLTHREIAEQIGRSENAVQKLLSRSLLKLERYLSTKATGVSAGALSALLADSLKGQTLTPGFEKSLAGTACKQSMRVSEASTRASAFRQLFSTIPSSFLVSAILAFSLGVGALCVLMLKNRDYEYGFMFAGGSGHWGTPAQTAQLSAQTRTWLVARGYERVESPAVAEARLGTASRGAYEEGGTTWILPGAQHFFVITEHGDQLSPLVCYWAKGEKGEVRKGGREALEVMREFQLEIISKYPVNSADEIVELIDKELRRSDKGPSFFERFFFPSSVVL